MVVGVVYWAVYMNTDQTTALSRHRFAGSMYTIIIYIL